MFYSGALKQIGFNRYQTALEFYMIGLLGQKEDEYNFEHKYG